jgi:hypothetical protein
MKGEKRSMTDTELTAKKVGQALADIRRAREFLAQRKSDRADASLSDAQTTLAFFWDYINGKANQ